MSDNPNWPAGYAEKWHAVVDATRAEEIAVQGVPPVAYVPCARPTEPLLLLAGDRGGEFSIFLGRETGRIYEFDRQPNIPLDIDLAATGAVLNWSVFDPTATP